jgi:O-antigen/teichoic acid export membrane protein
MISPESKFVLLWNKRHLASLFFGSVLSQLVIFFSTIVICRIYTPSEYGRYALIVGLAGLMAPLFTFSLENFIAPSRDIHLAQKLFKTGCKRIIQTATFLLFVLAIFQLLRINQIVDLNLNYGHFFLTILLCCLFGIYSLLTQLAVREKEFKRLSIRGTLQNTSIAVSQIGMNIFTKSSSGLLIGEIMGRIVGVISLVPVVRKIKREAKPVLSEETTEEIERSVILINIVSVLLELSCGYVLIYAVNTFFGKSSTGEVSLSLRILALPTVLIGMSLTQYFLSMSSSAARQKSFMSSFEFRRILFNLSKIAIGTSIMIFVLTPLLLPKILGDEWSTSPRILLALLPSFTISLIWSPLSTLFYVYSKWKVFLYLTLSRLCLILFGITISTITQQSLYIFVGVVSFCGSIAQIIGIFLISRFVSRASSS